MKTDELLDDAIPMSNAFRLLCEDATPKPEKKIVDSQKNTVKRIQNELNSDSLKLKIEYKKLDFWTAHGIKHPLHHLQEAINETSSSVPDFQWKKPKIHVLDSNFPTIFLEIPAELFGNRDFLNLTYPAKRAHFICSVAKILEKNSKKLEFQFGGIEKTDAIFPDLVVDGVKIGFFAGNLAKTKRFSPIIGNLRPATIFGDGLFEENEIATPKFNQRMLWSILEFELLQELENELKPIPTARRALRLFHQFFVNRHFPSVTTVIQTARVVRLIKLGKITENQEILTILRLIFRNFISWPSDDVEFLNPEGEEDVENEEYSQNFEVNFIWKHLNLAWNITKNQLDRMKKELATCLPLLGQVYTFDSIFIEKLPIFSQYDHLARLQIDYSQLKSELKTLAVDSVDSNDVINGFLRKFEKIIEKTMGERVEYVAIHEIAEKPRNSTWQPSVYPKECRQKTFLIGFRSTSTWKNPLTVGPPAQTEEAKEFRKLWQETSELRKFADTRICECVVWSEHPSDKVPVAILQFILKKMFNLPSTCISWRSALTSLDSDSDEKHEKMSQEAVSKAFFDLSTMLRAMKGLPLMITNVHGISGYLRGTEPSYPSIFAAHPATSSTPPGGSRHVALPEDGKIPLFTPTVTVHIKLEYSGKWGNDVEAIRRLTSSFYLKIAERLRSDQKLCAVPTIDQLFILEKSGIVFKIVVVNDRILTILEEDVQKLKDSGATRIESSIQGVRLTMWKKKCIAEPLLQLSLQSYSTSHKFFGSTVQLLKKWLGSKMLSGHLNDHIIELLVVAAISKKGAVEPQSTFSSFCRVLNLISTHPWSARPLIVNFGAKGYSEEELSKLEEKFIKMRPILPPMVVIHSEDELGSKFTRDAPTGIVLNRLVAVAGESLRIMEKQAIGEKNLDLKTSLLSENLSPYDAIIHLDPVAVVRKKPLIERKPIIQSENSKKAMRIPVAELDPIDELIYQLNNSFHQVAMFFYNKYGGHHIGLMFKPQEEEVPAKISRCSLHKSVSDSSLRLNRAEILENIQIMGEGIVLEVELKK